MAKKYHPDLPGADEARFRLVTEAYTVLSNMETRVRYDMTRNVMSTSEVEKILNKTREKDGLDVKPTDFKPHEYGYQRLKELADIRKKYNIDKFNKYRGGLPNKTGIKRGNALGMPGERVFFSDVDEARHLGDSRTIPFSSRRVDETEADQFKISKGYDYAAQSAPKPYLPAEIDYEFAKATIFKKYVVFWAVFGLIVTFPKFRNEVLKGVNRYQLEQLEDKGKTPHMGAVGFKTTLGMGYFS
jgi:curved DNA-binding protein CbpA